MTMQTQGRVNRHRPLLSRFGLWKRHMRSAQRTQPPKQAKSSQPSPRRLPLPGYGLTVWEG
jgi:hypothetical protein